MITISIVMHHHHLRVLPAKGSEEFVHLVASQAGETEAQAFQAGQASVGTIMILGEYFTMVFHNIWKQQKNWERTLPTILRSSLRATSSSLCSPKRKLLVFKKYLKISKISENI